MVAGGRQLGRRQGFVLEIICARIGLEAAGCGSLVYKLTVEFVADVWGF